MKKFEIALRMAAVLLLAGFCLVSTAFASSEEVVAITEETASPVVYGYDIRITPPSGWYKDSAEVEITISDVYDTGWDSAVLVCPGTGGTVQITEASAAIPISENGTYTVRVTDPDGGTHEVSQAIECFDTTAPTVTAGIRDKVLHCEASDSQSGVYGILVDGNLYTTLKDGALDLRLEDYADGGKTLSVTAIDNMGNRSALTTIDNPYYTTATSAPASTNAPVIIYTGTQDSGTSSTQTTTTTPTTTTSTTAATTSTSTTSTTSKTENTTVDTSDTEVVLTAGSGFSENGNAVTRDLLYDQYTNKQFITIQTRNGKTLYLVIDYDKVSDENEEQYQTYFLNPVDESDLLALLDDDTLAALTGSGEDEETAISVCACAQKCIIGSIDTTCSVCRTDLSKCTGLEAVTPTPEATEMPDKTESTAEASGSKGGSVLTVLLVFGLIGGGVFYYLKNKKDKPKTVGSTDFDDYDFGEDDEDEIEEISEDEETSTHDSAHYPY